MSLGEYPAVTLAEARDELRKHHKTHEAAKKGQADHPVKVAQFERGAAKAQPTVAEAFGMWLEDKRHGSRRKDGRPVRDRTLFILKQNFDADVRDRIGDMKMATITAEALRKCIDAPRERKKPGAAAQVYRTLRGLVNFAIERGYIDVDPMRAIKNPKPYRPQPVNAANDAQLALGQGPHRGPQGKERHCWPL